MWAPVNCTETVNLELMEHCLNTGHGPLNNGYVTRMLITCLYGSPYIYACNKVSEMPLHM